MTARHVWKKAPKDWTCTSRLRSSGKTCWDPAVVGCVKCRGLICWEGRCSRHKPRKRGKS